MSEISIAPGTEISLHFALLLEDGSEVDSTFNRQPARFVFGDGSLLPSVEAKLVGLTAGSAEVFDLPPEEAFGQRNPGNIQRIPRSQFDKDMALQEGLVISFADASRAELPGVISAIEDDMVEVDFNHPLAGRRLQFKVEILGVSLAEGQ